MSRFGLAEVRRWAGKQRDLGSNPLRWLSFLCGHCLVTLSLTINETLKWLPSLPILMQESFWWCQCSDRYIIYLFPHFHTPSPFSPSLISFVVSVDVKHHVYLLTRFQPPSPRPPPLPTHTQGNSSTQHITPPLDTRYTPVSSSKTLVSLTQNYNVRLK